MWKAELIQKEWRNKAERWLKQPHTKEKKMDKWSPILQRKESPRWKAQGAKTLCQLILGHTWLDLSVCCYFFWKPIVEFRNHWIDTFVCVHSLSPVFSRALRLQVTCWTPGCPVNLKETGRLRSDRAGFSSRALAMWGIRTWHFWHPSPCVFVFKQAYSHTVSILRLESVRWRTRLAILALLGNSCCFWLQRFILLNRH